MTGVRAAAIAVGGRRPRERGVAVAVSAKRCGAAELAPGAER